MTRLFTLFAVCSVALASTARAQDVPAEYQQVLTTLGKQGDYKANVLKVNIPRNDLNVTVASVKTPTPFGFGGWVALTTIYFLHYWGTGPAEKLATSFKAALKELGRSSPSTAAKR